MNLPPSGLAMRDDARFDVRASATDAPARRVQVCVGRDVMAIAEIVQGADARLCFREAVGRLPVRDRVRLVDAVFDLFAVEPGTRLAVGLPVREVDVLSHLLAHCSDAHAHAAGATCVVDAIVASAAPTTDERR